MDLPLLAEPLGLGFGSQQMLASLLYSPKIFCQEVMTLTQTPLLILAFIEPKIEVSHTAEFF